MKKNSIFLKQLCFLILNRSQINIKENTPLGNIFYGIDHTPNVVSNNIEDAAANTSGTLSNTNEILPHLRPGPKANSNPERYCGV